MPTLQSIDVVIPVYNAPILTRRCIDSVVAILGRLIRYVHVQDDASNAETSEMLDSLTYPCVRVYHAKKNQGFGLSVNEAIKRSDAELILVLNSDTEVREDILTPLCAAMTADPQLAVISPNHKSLAKHHVNRFIRRPGGYVPAYRLQGHAFLIRRTVFKMLDGFDPIYGRGYFEDIDLGRRLVLCGWRIGVHPDIHIIHNGGGSFGRGLAYHKLITINRACYLARYPSANRNIILLSGCYMLADLPVDLLDEIETVFREGGTLHWLTPAPAPQLFCFHMRNSSINLWTSVKSMLRGLKRQDKRISEIWLFPGMPNFYNRLFLTYARYRNLKIKSWSAKDQKSSSSYSVTV
ncbi:MAG: glycosyltransferase [Nitrosomonas sp.]|nr:glycosyltransferase [Nitrosomonas sp.]